jgi:hypothetical protein
MSEMIRCWLSRKQNYDYRGRDMEEEVDLIEEL